MKPPTLKTIALLGAACGLLAGPASAADFFLRAGVTSKTMPDGRIVPMWGFALDSSFGANDGVITVPGPMLIVPPGDPILRIHLDNNLSVPISLIIHGQISTNMPVRHPDGRVRSFTHETPPGNGAAVTYTWPDVKPGTFLYQSGTHPQVQAPMGLYGAMKKDTSALVAYPGVPYATDVTLLYSEIDPILNDAVAANDFGPTNSLTSTLEYEAKYFLINGQPFTNGIPPIMAGTSNARILLRLLNAGLEARMPVIGGYYVDEVAEDGNLHPFPKRQFAMHLPPAKTLDALFTPTTCNLVAVYDRRLGLANHTNSPGGMLTYLSVSGSLTLLGCLADGGEVGVPYNSLVVASCGTPPYTYSIFSGALPAGLMLNTNTGTITGTPTTAGTNNFVTRVADSVAGVFDLSCSITIAPPLMLACPATTTGEVGVAYTSGLVASGGATPYNYSIISGALPAGLTLDPTAGVIAGTPTTAGTNNFVARATDPLRGSITQSCSITIAPLLTLACPSVTSGEAGVAYNSGFVAGGGLMPYAFSIISGALPNGLTLNTNTGTIVGVPMSAGTNSFVARVADPLGGSVTQSCSIVIAPGSLIGKWRFDDLTGTIAVDSSGLNNHGRLTNGAVFSAAGRIGGSITLDGVNDFVFVPDNNALEFNSTNFTLALWVKTTRTVNQALVEKQAPDFSGMFLFALNRDNVVPGGFSVWTGVQWIDSIFRGVTNGLWHHLAVTYNGGTFRLYRDGILDRTFVAGNTYVATAFPLNFGRFATANISWPFQGMLDEICKFNRALADSEILALASGTAPTRILTVASVNPTNGVNITVSPNATNGLGNGTTPFTRVYSNTTVVTLTAPAMVGSNSFVNWQRDGANYSTSLTTNLIMDADHTMTAIYQALAPATRTLTVASVNPTNGVNITVTPNATNGLGNGATPFTRVYSNNAVVTLTAPAMAASNSFVNWQRDGTNYSTSLTTNLTMDANHTMTAIYQSSIPTGAAGYWKLDDGSGTTALDSSGNGNLGRLTNGAVFSAMGRVNGSLTLDGVNDFVFVPDSNVLDFNARNFTVALWVKTTNILNQALVEKQHSGFTGMFLFALNRDNLSATRGHFSVWTGGAWQDSVFAGMNDGAWHHVAITFNGTQFRFYHNGALDRTTTAAASYANTTLPLNFGRFGTLNAGWPLNGMLDEIYKFDRALTDAEIAALAGVP